MNPTVLHKICQCFIQFANKQHSTTPVPTWQSSWRACHSWFWTLKGRYVPYSHIFFVLFCLQWNCVERRWRPMEPPTKLARFGLVPGRHRISDFCEQYSNSLFDLCFHQDELMLKDECILVNYMDEALAPFNCQGLGKTEPCFFGSRWLVTTTSTTATNSCRVNHVVCCLGLNKMAWNLVRVILFGYRADENWWKNPNAIDATCVTHHWPEKNVFRHRAFSVLLFDHENRLLSIAWPTFEWLQSETNCVFLLRAEVAAESQDQDHLSTCLDQHLSDSKSARVKTQDIWNKQNIGLNRADARLQPSSLRDETLRSGYAWILLMWQSLGNLHIIQSWNFQGQMPLRVVIQKVWRHLHQNSFAMSVFWYTVYTEKDPRTNSKLYFHRTGSSGSKTWSWIGYSSRAKLRNKGFHLDFCNNNFALVDLYLTQYHKLTWLYVR